MVACTPMGAAALGPQKSRPPCRRRLVAAEGHRECDEEVNNNSSGFCLCSQGVVTSTCTPRPPPPPPPGPTPSRSARQGSTCISCCRSTAARALSLQL